MLEAAAAEPGRMALSEGVSKGSSSQLWIAPSAKAYMQPSSTCQVSGGTRLCCNISCTLLTGRVLAWQGQCQGRQHAPHLRGREAEVVSQDSHGLGCEEDSVSAQVQREPGKGSSSSRGNGCSNFSSSHSCWKLCHSSGSCSTGSAQLQRHMTARSVQGTPPLL